jgi:hypothetical protein
MGALYRDDFVFRLRLVDDYIRNIFDLQSNPCYISSAILLTSSVN